MRQVVAFTLRLRHSAERGVAAFLTEPGGSDGLRSLLRAARRLLPGAHGMSDATVLALVGFGSRE